MIPRQLKFFPVYDCFKAFHRPIVKSVHHMTQDGEDNEPPKFDEEVIYMKLILYLLYTGVYASCTFLWFS